MRQTRFSELSYDQFGSDWRFIDNSTGCAIGPYYKTKTELLADLERFAVQFGCDA